MALPLPHVLDGEIQDNFDEIAKQFPLVGFLRLAVVADRKEALGTGTLTWPGGSQFSTGLTITHGLGTTPINVQTSVVGGATPLLALSQSSIGGTTFVVAAQTIDGSSPANTRTDTIHWRAVG